MSKVTLTVDTEKNESSVNVDGTTIDNISDFNLHKFKDFDGNSQLDLRIVTEVEKVGDLKSVTIVRASDESAKAALNHNYGKKVGSTKDLVMIHPDFNIANSVAQMLGRNLN